MRYGRENFKNKTGKLTEHMEIRQRNLLKTEDLARISAPTLVIWGRENPFADVPEATKMQEAIPGAELELFERCGHGPQHEHADRYNELAIRFLRKHSV